MALKAPTDRLARSRAANRRAVRNAKPPESQQSPAALESLAAIQGLPTTIFINRAGKVLYVHTGQYDSQGTLDHDISGNRGSGLSVSTSVCGTPLSGLPDARPWARRANAPARSSR